MKDRYDGNPGKDSRMAKVRHTRLEAEHRGRNQFVRSEQNKMDKYAGKNPRLEAKDMDFNAEMMNDGAHAQRFAKSLTRNIDPCFPVDGEGDDS